MFLPLHDTNSLNHVKLQWVTLGLIGANILIWVFFSTPSITSANSVHATFLSFGYIPAVINGYEILPPVYVVLPEQTSFITYAFFHSGFMHLAGNMLFLWVFGDNVEDALGHFKFLFFYLASAAAGAFVHGIVDPKSVAPLIGASGAAAGVIAGYLMLHPRVKIWVLMFGKIPLHISAFWAIGAWISFQVYQLVFNSESDVSWGAHVGGIFMGLVLVLFLRRPGVPLFDQNIDGKPDPVAPEAADVSVNKQVTKPQARWGREGRED